MMIKYKTMRDAHQPTPNLSSAAALLRYFLSLLSSLIHMLLTYSTLICCSFIARIRIDRIKTTERDSRISLARNGDVRLNVVIRKGANSNFCTFSATHSLYFLSAAPLHYNLGRKCRKWSFPLVIHKG